LAIRRPKNRAQGSITFNSARLPFGLAIRASAGQATRTDNACGTTRSWKPLLHPRRTQSSGCALSTLITLKARGHCRRRRARRVACLESTDGAALSTDDAHVIRCMPLRAMPRSDARIHIESCGKSKNPSHASSSPVPVRQSAAGPNRSVPRNLAPGPRPVTCVVFSRRATGPLA